MTVRRKFEIVGLLLLVIGSFVIASRASLPFLIRSARERTPDNFSVIVYSPPDWIELRPFPSLDTATPMPPGATFLIPTTQIDALNAELARRYTGHGGTWQFELLASDGGRQYIHVTTSGESSVTESWYWATADRIEPDRYRSLNRSVLIVVLPFTAVLTGLGVLGYVLMRRYLDPQRRAG